MSLKTIEEYNAEVREARERASWSGILCPACKERELRWQGSMALSYPPKRGVICACGWQGFVDG